MRSDKHQGKTGAQHRAERNKKRALPFFLGAVVILVVVFLGAWTAMHALGDKQVFSGDDTVGDAAAPADEFVERFGESERVNFLLLGSDGVLTDTIMVASYDMKNQHVDLVSVPRDSYYPRAGRSGASNKVNAIFAGKDGGAAATAAAVSDILNGMPIHYYMRVDYEGVANIVEAIGGVTFNVPFHMKYEDTTKGHQLFIDVPKGERRLNEKNVIQFLRFRQTNPWFKRQGYQDYGSMDIGRMETHQAFMKAALKQSMGPNFMTVMKAVLKNVESDLDMEMAVKLAAKAGSLDGENISSYTLPGISKMKEGTSVWLLDEEGVEEILAEIYRRAEQPELEQPEL